MGPEDVVRSKTTPENAYMEIYRFMKVQSRGAKSMYF